MQILLCQKSIDRLGQRRAPLLDALRERGHTPVVRDCLTRCRACELGQLVALVDNMPITARAPDAFLADIDELAAAEG